MLNNFNPITKVDSATQYFSVTGQSQPSHSSCISRASEADLGSALDPNKCRLNQVMLARVQGQSLMAFDMDVD
ncbi:hypothetical protein COCSUDRAFT_32026 [Coccomyxa subellipsoidea C-169]|uniref:Uncharacterized protein n=1 Tax=Coccomyxa subellipsoidea (strain C-169) TaxID=574566 RepID=I0ZA43_COCSC|nr:hypothetical protein COCSUDRAFT_32026 [Coccomyxa subellipsoidea C-169]EIE27512.1 hypothetical protein COCSUDRAFT_32026 [Coccomyxa subellipsoidea C-169]|eukprot:XP_005652056.1 hypothetical protein COCSUDRAFT_32026 [Coccomyxa subellipsoidea C-169]